MGEGGGGAPVEYKESLRKHLSAMNPPHDACVITLTYSDVIKFLYIFLCYSPSVLDRLNGLLEPNGVLSINERGIIEGEIPTIIPHPNFR